MNQRSSFDFEGYKGTERKTFRARIITESIDDLPYISFRLYSTVPFSLPGIFLSPIR